VLRRLLGLVWRYRLACLRVLLLQLLLVTLNLSGLRLTGLGIDVVRHQFEPGSAPARWPWGWQPPASWSAMQCVLAIAGGILVLALVHASLRYATTLAHTSLSQRVLLQLRTDVYEKLQRLSFRFFDAAESSSLINRAAGDVQAVRVFVDGVALKIVTVLISLGVYLGYMLSMHVPLTLACLATTPLLWTGAVLFSRWVQPEYRRSRELLDDLILVLVENLQGVHVVKGFARQQEQLARFEAANREVREQKRRIFWRVSSYQPLMGGLTQVNMLVLLAYGGYLVVQGQLALGAGLFVFANLLQEFASQVGHITSIASTVQNSLAGAGRVLEVLDAPVEITSPPGAQRLPRARGSVRFDHVTFAYASGPRVLDEVTFHAQPGECLGIVGETGAGKSTLLGLLARFYDVESGAVLVDGHDVRTLDLDDLRRNIGLVFQESFLFSNTVAANIAFGYPQAPLERIVEAARIAAADAFIGQLPKGYDTLIGEYGNNLSGGQRQRIAIARALLLDPPILLLDDATAAVDAQTEHDIQLALRQAMQGRTTLIVSNRLSTLQRTDRLMVLEKGRIVQQGSHAELVRVPGPYRRLAELQFTDLQSPEEAALPAS